MVRALLAGYEHHAYGHHHHTAHEHHPLDDILGWNHEPAVHYHWVGEGKGRYRERGHGHFDYVGPHCGDYEKEVLPQDHTCRYLGMCACLLILALGTVVCVKVLLEDPPFDCQEGYANWEAGWSVMKKDWCCENRNMGCPFDSTTSPPEFSTTPVPEVPEQPHWLRLWLADMNIGAKFIMTCVLALIVGCSCGAFCLYLGVRYFIPPKASQTELELIAEVNRLLARADAPTRGELSVSLMWDTTTDIDLHLKTPDGFEISWERLEHNGGRLEYDVNSGLAMKKKHKVPCEHISWGPYDPEHPEHNPPEGNYEVWVKVADRHVLHADANLTVVKTVRGKRDCFHHRLVPGCFEKKVLSFYYSHPAGHHHGHHGSPGNHGHHHRRAPTAE